MRTSEYLNIQADLLSAWHELRKARLEEYLAMARELAAGSAPLVDHNGWPVAGDPGRMAEMAEAAIEFRERVMRYGAGHGHSGGHSGDHSRQMFPAYDAEESKPAPVRVIVRDGRRLDPPVVVEAKAERKAKGWGQ